MDKPVHALGICLGASTVSTVLVLGQNSDATDRGGQRPVIVSSAVQPHDGNPRLTVARMLEAVDWRCVDAVATTGRKFRAMLNLSSIPEPAAAEQAYEFVRPASLHCPAIISAGGETFMVYVLDSYGKISSVLTGNKCAAGTGEFFLQQLRRMDVSLAAAAQWAVEPDPYQVSGRCSVFCKSDCTHATNKGIPKSRVTAGLGIMMANKILELLKTTQRRNLMIVGGTTRNHMMLEYLHRALPGLIVPEQAPYFEALGAALWALAHNTRPFPGMSDLFVQQQSLFDVLPPLKDYRGQVTFKSMAHDRVRPGDVCILGLDVGSTTTKAVLIRETDYALLADVYLRTNGDPVGASRRCYQAIVEQIREHIDPADIRITGLGVCGSGRQIAGLHALTPGVINEIIAHAAAAVYFDAEVDTIFEIGGQDAKYTYITNGVPSDYAMNEACSAGTGSFLEESALETLKVPMEEIAATALQGPRPPNFNDQCAAFISSDIKNAIHDGIAREDITAGLVYSICMNYNNRVKGNRPMGAKIFMQGGVCYNLAVPMAMAALTGKPIIVPPEPGLMGAFGAALEVKKRQTAGLLPCDRFDLDTLANRPVAYGPSFTCRGGAEKCDRRCAISRIIIDDTSYPFGGACNRYDNLRRHLKVDAATLDLVRIRQRLIFEKHAPAPLDPGADRYRGCIGFNRSFLVNTYFPLYAHFFSTLGYEPVLPTSPDPAGIDQRRAPFCYPAELAHGFFHDLIAGSDPPEYIFLPHFKSLPPLNGERNAQVCPLVQGEPFYLQSAFRSQLKTFDPHGTRILSPLINLSKGLAAARRPLIETAVQMGITARRAAAAFDSALTAMQECLADMRANGRQAVAELEQDPDRIGVVLFARPYNGFVEEAHKGIPHKLASRNVLVLPFDFLEIEDQPSKKGMYWGMGQRILNGARRILNHDQLFGTYITNFSCGPDSFIIGYFRDIMGRKPSLTLELDNHTADAGIETRIEAFLDIVQAYRQLSRHKGRLSRHKGRLSSHSGRQSGRNAFAVCTSDFSPARVTSTNHRLQVIRSDGSILAADDPRVTVVFPSMGDIGTRTLAAAFRHDGFHVQAHEPSDEAILKLGRGNTSCKECLPLILTTGILLDCVHKRGESSQVMLYFMPTGSGPCRFGQYRYFMEDLICKRRIADVAILSISSDDGYDGFPTSFHRRAWWAVVISDAMEDMRAMLLANTVDAQAAIPIFNRELDLVLRALEKESWPGLERALTQCADRLRSIRMKRPVQQVPIISLTGEIFVRRDGLSRQHLTEQLADKGFATACAPVAEWVYYSDYIVQKKYSDHTHQGWRNRIGARIKHRFMTWDERRIRQILARSGLIHADPIDIPAVINTARPYISPYLGGEAILTVGSSLKEVVSHSCGVIAIGPFGCMPNRLSEALLGEAMTSSRKLESDPHNRRLPSLLADVQDLPFLAIECDGSPFPQLINAKLEAFCLQAERLFERMQRH